MYLAALSSGNAGFRHRLRKMAIEHNPSSTELMEEDIFENGQDNLGHEEFQSALQSQWLSAEDATEAFHRADENNDKILNKAEFRSGINHVVSRSRSRLEERFIKESSKTICQIGAYEPIYIEAKGQDWFAAAAMAVNTVQSAVWLISSAGFLVLCPAHTLYGVIITMAIVLVLALCLLAASAVFAGARRAMGRPTKLFGGVTVAGFSSAIAACVALCVGGYFLARFDVYLLPAGYHYEWSWHGEEL